MHCVEEGERGEGKKTESVEKKLGYFLIDALCTGVDWCRFEGGRGGREKNGVGPSFCKVIFIDSLVRGWIEEWNGVGLRVGLDVY